MEPWNKTVLRILALVLAAAVTGAVIFLISRNRNLTGQVNKMARQQSYYSAQLAKDTSQIAAAQSRVNGNHRDLITCADLQALISTIENAGDTNGDTLQFPPHYSSVISIPAHCLNP